MKKILAVFLSLSFLLPSLVFAQGEKPVAALGRVALLGKITDAERKIISNRIENFLSQHYRLISQQEYLKAEEAAFAALDEKECTEANCIRKIQEILQIERLFILQIIREEGLTQLSLSLFQDDNRKVAEEICEKCSLSDLYVKVQGLVGRLVSGDLGAGAVDVVAASVSAPAKSSGTSWWVWVLGVVGVAAVASLAGGTEPAVTTGETGSVTVTW